MEQTSVELLYGRVLLGLTLAVQAPLAFHTLAAHTDTVR